VYKQRVSNICSAPTRYLALLAAGLGATAISISISPLFAVFSAAQVIGALLLKRFPRIGMILVWNGAIILSLGIIPIGLGMAVTSPKELIRYHDFNSVGITLLWCLAMVLQIWTDVRLVEIMKKRTAAVG
jgi:hypothetical protein